jgi:hypothetical protein
MARPCINDLPGHFLQQSLPEIAVGIALPFPDNIDHLFHRIPPSVGKMPAGIRRAGTVIGAGSVCRVTREIPEVGA